MQYSRADGDFTENNEIMLIHLNFNAKTNFYHVFSKLLVENCSDSNHTGMEHESTVAFVSNCILDMAQGANLIQIGLLSLTVCLCLSPHFKNTK